MSYRLRLNFQTGGGRQPDHHRIQRRHAVQPWLDSQGNRCIHESVPTHNYEYHPGNLPEAGHLQQAGTGTVHACIKMFPHKSVHESGRICFGAPSGRMFQRVRVPNPPDSGKDIAKSKGVPGNWESEGSWRQITGLTNRNHEG